MKKETLLESVKDLPNEFKLDELIERLIFIEKVEEGIKAAKNGEVVTHDEVLEHFRKKWK